MSAGRRDSAPLDPAADEGDPPVEGLEVLGHLLVQFPQSELEMPTVLGPVQGLLDRLGEEDDFHRDGRRKHELDGHASRGRQRVRYRRNRTDSDDEPERYANDARPHWAQDLELGILLSGTHEPASARFRARADSNGRWRQNSDSVSTRTTSVDWKLTSASRVRG